MFNAGPREDAAARGFAVVLNRPGYGGLDASGRVSALSSMSSEMLSLEPSGEPTSGEAVVRDAPICEPCHPAILFHRRPEAKPGGALWLTLKDL